MSADIEYVSGHLFVYGFRGFLHDDYFICHCKICPYSVALIFEEVNGKRTAVSCKYVVCPVHFHDSDGRTSAQIRNDVKAQLKLIARNPDDPVAKLYKDQHAFWERIAKKESKRYREQLINLVALTIYALNHPGKSIHKTVRDCGVSLNARSLCNRVRREKVKQGVATSIRNLIETGGHHLLGHDGEDILVFGHPSALHFLSTTPLIEGDGTFTCLVSPYSQLYMFHALVDNGVIFPVLYCLVAGKNEAIYRRLLALVERIADAHKTTVFNRPVRLLVDFELAFINAAREYAVGSRVSCCFFHYTKNLKDKARPILQAIKESAGKESAEMGLAERTKRALMMLPCSPRSSSRRASWSLSCPAGTGRSPNDAARSKSCGGTSSATMSARAPASRSTSGQSVGARRGPTTPPRARTRDSTRRSASPARSPSTCSSSRSRRR